MSRIVKFYFARSFALRASMAGFPVRADKFGALALFGEVYRAYRDSRDTPECAETLEGINGSEFLFILNPPPPIGLV